MQAPVEAASRWNSATRVKQTLGNTLRNKALTLNQIAAFPAWVVFGLPSLFPWNALGTNTRPFTLPQIRESPGIRGFQRFRWCGRRDSNSHTLRRQNLNLVCLPISPRPQSFKQKRQATPGVSEYGVDDGVRTHDRRSHNPVLYQLSYAHHIALLVPEPRNWRTRQDSNLRPSA